MFVHFIIFCIILVITSMGTQTGIIRPRTAPVFSALSGGALGLAYNGAVIPGAVAGLLAAAVWAVCFSALD